MFEVSAWCIEQRHAGLLVLPDKTNVQSLVGQASRRQCGSRFSPHSDDLAISARDSLPFWTVLSGDAVGLPKSGDDTVEMVRVLRVARKTAVQARTQAMNALQAVVVTAPAELRELLRTLSGSTLVQKCARLRPGPLTTPTAATKAALRSLAIRYQCLSKEMAGLAASLDQLVLKAAPGLVALFGVGTDSAGALLVAAGDNPERMHSEAGFSMLCGASPIEASSGKVARHRLNRGGDRQANAALHRVVLVRLCWDQATKDYVDRRTAQGKSKREVIRCLKRYVAREVYRVLMSASHTTEVDHAVA